MNPPAKLDSASLPPAENDLSRRYLDIITRWAHVGMATYQDWPVRPNCGHFFGGVHWYGNETANTIVTLAAAASSPELCETKARYSADELRQAALRGLRYLLFTHDTGPADCVRPEKGWGRTEPAGKKWGEKGRGFFPESQCGRTVANIVKTAVLIRDLLGEEELTMLGAVAADYLQRFGDMPPADGVYNNTQTEENAWTALGLVACLVVLPDIENAEKLWHQAKLWMFRTSTTPQDAQNSCDYDGGKVSSWCGRTFTTLPDLTAENHGVVHPSYMGSAIVLSGMAMDLLKLFGRPIPPQILWRRRDVYEIQKLWSDALGCAHAPQGMDWPYFILSASICTHAAAACYYDDPDAARFEHECLAVVEKAFASRDGATIPAEVKEHGHSVQDPMVMGEIHVDQFAHAYLRHRLCGPGPKPTPIADVRKHCNGVYVYPSGGLLIHNHPRGLSSFSWRNRTTIIPQPSEGVGFVGPAPNSILGQYVVTGKGHSENNRNLVIRELTDRVSVLLIQDIAGDTIRRKVFFCSLPDGRGMSYEVAHALADITVESCTLGYLQIINDSYFGPPSARTLYWPGGSRSFRGYISDSAKDDVTRDLTGFDWINIDDRMGFRFAGTGAASYINKHFYKVYHAVYDELTLGRHPDSRAFKTGDKVAELTIMWLPERDHDSTAKAKFEVLKTPPDVFAARVDGWLCACNFGPDEHKLDGVLLEPTEPRLIRTP
jgi:hypothetical protein